MNNDNKNNNNNISSNYSSADYSSSEHSSSIHEFDFNIICEYFSSVKRQGPGSDETTRRAMGMIEGIDKVELIADLGCGCGSQTLQLALNSKAHVKALDLFPLFIDKTMENCREAGVADRVEGIVGDMGHLPFEQGSFDLIWSEGAIYNIGFERGMSEWRHYLKAGGHVAVSEASWLTDSRPEEIARFWLDAYPEMDTIATKTAIMEKLGFTDIKTFVLPEACWTTHFYQPQAEAQRLFLKRYPDNETARSLVENQRHEAQLYQKYHDYYGYVFYIGKK